MNYEKIKALIAAGDKATQGEWLFKAFPYDDWGVIRTSMTCEDGHHYIVAQARAGQVYDVWKNRQNKIDPYEHNANFIMQAANARDELKAMYDELMRLREGKSNHYYKDFFEISNALHGANTELRKRAEIIEDLYKCLESLLKDKNGLSAGFAESALNRYAELIHGRS